MGESWGEGQLRASCTFGEEGFVAAQGELDVLGKLGGFDTTQSEP